MKTIAFLLLLAAPVLAHATDIHLGDSLADVRAALGVPNGQEQQNNTLTLFYDHGQVQLVDGRVVSSYFLSPEKSATKQAQQKADDAKAQQKADEAKAAQLRAQRIAEGKALKAQKLADPNFTAELPGIQLAFWQDFRARYPEVSCDNEYKLALNHWNAVQEQIADQGPPIPAQEDAAGQPYYSTYYPQSYYLPYSRCPTYDHHSEYHSFFHDNDHGHSDHDGDDH
jgi:hypothetical protein